MCSRHMFESPLFNFSITLRMAADTSSSSAGLFEGTKNIDPRVSVTSQRRSSVSGRRFVRSGMSLAGVSTTSTSVGVGVGASIAGQEVAGVVGGDGDGCATAGTKNAGLPAGLLRLGVDVGLDDTEGVAGASEVALTSHRSAKR